MNFKNLIFFYFFILISINNSYSQQCESYRVINIDSTNSYYLIMVEKNEIEYLIVSSKRTIKPQCKINLFESYNFKLLEHKWIEELSHNMKVGATSIVVEGKTIWSTEDDYSVYRTKNLKGLNYIRKRGCTNKSN